MSRQTNGNNLTNIPKNKILEVHFKTIFKI